MTSAMKICVRFAFFSFCLAAFLFGYHAVAQRNSDMAKATALLQPDERTVVNRLGTLHELPSGTWKMHAGDVAPVSYTHLRAHETGRNLVCRLLLEKKK